MKVDPGVRGGGGERIGGTSERRARWSLLAAFLYLWLMVGFASGTLTLIGPARWVTSALRDGPAAGYEDYAMWAVMAAFVAGSFAVSLWLMRRLRRSSRTTVRLGIPGFATLAAGLALLGWRNPAAFGSVAGGRESQVALDSGVEILFGPYPDSTRLKQLKAEGYTAVISLQHPAVVPIEPQGIQAERDWADHLGLQFINAPMLPWISDNTESLAVIKDVVEHGHGRYYIHCGLGRDRVNVVKAMVERMGSAHVETTSDIVPARTFADRVEEGRFLMERGNFQVLANDLWLVPWPNEHEAFGKLFAGQIHHVTVLMDPSDPEQAAWIEQARKLFDGYQVPWTLYNYPHGDAHALETLAAEAWAFPRPGVVIVPYTQPCPKSQIAEAFLAVLHTAGGPSAAEIVPGAGDAKAEGRPLPCEATGR